MDYKGKEITKEMLEKAQQCKSVQDLLKLAEENGLELSAEEAEAFIDELADIELDEEILNQAAGGGGTPSWCKAKQSPCKKNTGISYD